MGAPRAYLDGYRQGLGLLAGSKENAEAGTTRKPRAMLKKCNDVRKGWRVVGGTLDRVTAGQMSP